MCERECWSLTHFWDWEEVFCGRGDILGSGRNIFGAGRNFGNRETRKNFLGVCRILGQREFAWLLGEFVGGVGTIFGGRRDFFGSQGL